MKKSIIITLISLGLCTTPLLHAQTLQASPNASLVIEIYKEFFEKKQSNLMNHYFAKNLQLYKDIEPVSNYTAFQQHLLEQNKQCIKLKMLPFDQIIASGNKVVALYTQYCTDSFNNIHKKRIMAIIEINDARKIANIWTVTHPEQETN